MTDSDSVLSAGTKTDDHEDSIADLSNEELATLVEESKRANEVLQIETEMLEKFYRRIEPKDSSLLNSETSSLISSGQEYAQLRGKRKTSRSNKTVDAESFWLSSDQKCDIAQRELEELRDELDELRCDSEKVLDNLKASLEEADVRLIELKKAVYEFERDICKLSVNARTKVVMAEKVVRYFEEKNKWRDALIEKLRLKNSTLRVQKKKVTMLLKQKEEMGEILHEVDFQQLKIENTQYLEKIDEKNQDLLRLKLMAGNTLQILGHYRNRLYGMTSESIRLRNEIQLKSENLIKFDEESVIVERERDKAERLNHQLRDRLSNYNVPHVQEYVQRKADLRELRKTVRSWERKVDIVQMALQNHKKAWQKMWTQTQQGAPWTRPNFGSTDKIF